MSKKLLRILAICIFATLIPVAIVAIAMAATMSAPFTISVEVKTQSNKDASQNVSISVNDRERNGLAVGVKADDKVTITFGDETSYDSNGFYAGNASAVTNKSDPVAEGYSYSFVVKGDATITLWVELKEYNVVYQDEEGNEIATAETLYHGDALKTINDQAFAGWVVMEAPEGYDITKNVVDTASFGISGKYVLKATDKLSMVVEYYAADETPITTQTIYQGQEVGLLPFDDEKVTSAIKPGYAAEKWVTAEGEEVTSLTFNAGKTVKLRLATSLLTYTTDVKFHKNSDDLAELTFDVEKGFAEYQTRQNYTLAGFEYDGVLYNYEVVSSGVIDYVNDTKEKLSAVIATAQGSDVETHAQLTAVWDVDFAAINGYTTFNFIFVPVGKGNIDASVSVKLPGASELTALTEKAVNKITFDRDEKYDLNQTLYSFFTGSDEAIVYLQNGESTDCSITYRIEQGGDSISGAKKDDTFAEFINKLVGYEGYEDRDPVYIYFNFS